MPNQRITAAANATNDLATLAIEQAPASKARLEALAAELGVTVNVDIAAVIVLLAELARAAATKAVAKEAAYASNVTGHKTPASDRDHSAQDLYAYLRDLRTVFGRTFGAVAAASVFVAGKTPREPLHLVANAEQAVAALTKPGATWTPLPNAPAPLDVAAATAKVVALLAAAKDHLQSVGEYDAGTKDARQAREDAYGTLHDQHQGLHHVLLGMHECAGAHDLADHVATHHHTSATKAETPAPAAPPPPPATEPAH
jgi:hypothetical protein